MPPAISPSEAIFDDCVKKFGTKPAYENFGVVLSFNDIDRLAVALSPSGPVHTAAPRLSGIVRSDEQISSNFRQAIPSLPQFMKTWFTAFVKQWAVEDAGDEHLQVQVPAVTKRD